MNFKEAYEQMLKGKKVRRPGWKGYWWIEDDKVFAKNNSWDAPQKRFSQVDIAHTAADDWEIIEESKENNEEEIDWNNLSQRKYVIIYDPEDQNVDVYCYWRTQYIPFNIHFTSEKIAQKAIETIGVDRIKKYYFDVED